MKSCSKMFPCPDSDFRAHARRVGLAALLAGIATTAAFGQNLLTNGDFSSFDSITHLPNSWSVESASASWVHVVQPDPTSPGSGYSQVLEIDTQNAGTSSLGYVSQSLNVASSGAPLTPNNNYAARVWVSENGTSIGLGEVEVKRFTGSGGSTEFKPRIDSPHSGSTWTRIQVGFDTNPVDDDADPGTPDVPITRVEVLLRYKKDATADGKHVYFAGAELLDGSNSTLGSLTLVPTFESVGVYAPINGAIVPGPTGHTVELSYRPTGTTTWLPALNADGYTTENEFRGSILQLDAGQGYDVQAVLKLNGTTIGSAQTASITTWTDSETVTNDRPISSQSTTLTITDAGADDSHWTHYHPSGSSATIDVGSTADNAIYVNNAAYVVIDGLTIKGGKRKAIYINNSHHIRIRNCDISGWSEAGTFGQNTTSGYEVKYGYFTGSPFTKDNLINLRGGIYVYGPGSYAIVIERNLIHHPVGRSASWAYSDNSNHPAGPSGIILETTGGNHVIRDNDIIAGDDNAIFGGHRFNDVIEGKENGLTTGGPSLDTDISGNVLSGSNDDGTELDGGQKNIRYWNNWVEGTHSQISTVPALQGPSYIFKNIFVGGDERGTTEDGFKLGGAPGIAHFINNTVYTQNYAFSGGHSGGSFFTTIATRNNLFTGPVVGNGLVKFDKSGAWSLLGDADYDLIPVNGINAISPATKEPNHVEGYPDFSDPDGRSFLLMPGSAGAAAGVVVPNVTPDGVSTPDMGAVDVATSASSFPLRAATPDVFPLRSVVRLRTGTQSTAALQLNAPTSTGSTWSATPGESWLSLSAASGSTGSTGSSVQPITCTIDATGLTVGPHHTFISFRTDQGALRTALLDVEVEPATDISFTMEAEDGLPSGGFALVSDSSASGGAYAHAYSGASGSIRQDFTIATAGDYYVHARVRADGPSAQLQNQNSFNLHVDNATDLAWSFAGVGTDWSWDTARVVPATVTADVTGPINFATGAHYIEIEKDSPGVQLDTIVVSNSPFPPRVATPAFSPGGGTYTSTQSVTITSATSGATIRYTTDGSAPTRTNGTIYTGAVNIGATTLLRAIAYKDQMEDSKPLEDFYSLGGAFQMSDIGGGVYQAVAEAENYTAKVDGTDSWSTVSDTNASGGERIDVTPDDGTAYATFDSAAAHVDYMINVPSGAPGSFYIHLRALAANSNADSVYLSIDDDTTSPIQLNLDHTGAFTWRTSSALSIGTGLHSVTVWEREDGAAVDKLVVSSSSTPPTGTGPAESSRSGTQQVAAPAFSPGEGVYFDSKSVTITCATSGATIRYTTDGSAPTQTNGTIYSSAISIASPTALRAIAYESGLADSDVTSAVYTIATVEPAYSPVAGTYSTGQTVTISTTTSGAAIRYTTDGSIPTSSTGTLYTGPVTLSSTAATTLNAIAYVSGLADSVVMSGTYSIQVAAPTFSPGAGTYAGTQSVTISSATSGAAIYYTTDGTTPTTTTGTLYTGAVSLGATTTLKAIATKSGWVNSTVTTGVFTITAAQVAAPTFSPAAGTYDLAQSVTISTTTGGATIYYTTDGTTPTPSSGLTYTGPVTIAVPTTLKAMAAAAGMTDSTVTSGSYTITAFQPDGNGDFVMEAEHDTSIVGSIDDWTAITDSSASGGGSNNAMQSLPNDGTAYATFDSSAAHLDYLINVPTGGNYYVHIRDYGATSSDDSVYVSIDDGSTTQTVTAGRTLDWKSSPGTLAIASGLHTVTVWDREDGAEIDKIVVSTSSTPPTGTGPAESARY